MTAWENKFINVNKYARSGKKLTAVRKLIMHYTANPGASAMNHYKYFSNLKDRYASAHFFVDRVDSLCIIPLNEVAYHANDVQKRVNGAAYRGVSALKPNANLLSLGIEMCIEKDGTIHPDTVKRSAAIAVELCKKYGLDPLTDIVRHYDVTAKNCPAPWVADKSQFEAFKVFVKNELAGNEPAIIPAPSNKVDSVIVKQPTKPTEQPKTKGNAVMMSIQTTLNNRYGTKLAIDGLYGPATKKALVTGLQTELNQQYRANLTVDGLYGPATASKVVNVHEGARGNITYIVQAALYALGYDTNGVDGIFGKGTTAAVKKFQKDKKLSADGVVGVNTWNKLF